MFKYKLTKAFEMQDVMNWSNNSDYSFKPYGSDENNTALFSSALDLADVDTTFINYQYDDEFLTQCFRQVCRKFYEENVLILDFKSLQAIEDFNNNEEKKYTYFQKLIYKFSNVIERTYPYYHALLKGYKKFEDELLEEITSTSTTESESSGTNKGESSNSDTSTTTNDLKNEVALGETSKRINKFNDTPQSTDTDLETDTYLTNVTRETNEKGGSNVTTDTGTTKVEGSGKSSNDTSSTSKGSSKTSSTIPFTPMQRLSEIQNAYKRVMADWVNEFKGCFLEKQGDDNYEEI